MAVAKSEPDPSRVERVKQRQRGGRARLKRKGMKKTKIFTKNLLFAESNHSVEDGNCKNEAGSEDGCEAGAH